MCKEETTHGIVWISVGLRIFVMDAMITGPVVNGALVGDGVAQHEEETDGERGGVGTVGPETMDADGDTEATENQITA